MGVWPSSKALPFEVHQLQEFLQRNGNETHPSSEQEQKDYLR